MALSSEKAKAMGYTGDPCRACGAFTLVKMGDLKKCHTCGTTNVPSGVPHPLDVMRAALEKSLEAMEHAHLEVSGHFSIRAHLQEAIKDTRKALEG